MACSDSHTLVIDRAKFRGSPLTEVTTMKRRRFIVKAGGVLAAAGAGAVIDAPNVIAQPKVQWRMPTTWTPALDVLQGAAQRLAKVVDEMSGGRFRIEVFPGGQIMPPFDCFDAILARQDRGV